MSNDTVHRYTDEQLRADVLRLAKPLEEAAFEAGKRAARAEAHEALRESAMLKLAQLRGLIPSGTTATKGKSPQELAKRANQLQLRALAEGKKISNIESVQAAYTEAGIAWK
ncbi:MAG TPA: hypothetical protein VNH65_07970 [Candidatus Acidoferrum sp.]|nr:hypothetical protein [Candidatus Acidoferrum sp.]